MYYFTNTYSFTQLNGYRNIGQGLLNEALDNVYAHQYNTTHVIQMLQLQMWYGILCNIHYLTYCEVVCCVSK